MTRLFVMGAAILAGVAVGPGSAHAQDNQSFANALNRLSVGHRVTITDGSGNETKGSVTRVSAGEFTVGDRTFREPEVRKIRRGGDSKWNGTLIGAALGTGVGLIGVASLGEYNSDGVAPMIVFGLGAGAGIGALVDGLINRSSTVFDSTKKRARLIPLVGPRRGVLVSLTY